MRIQRAEAEDLPQILEIQRLAYQAQARLNNDFTIPPLTETLEEVRGTFPSFVLLKAVGEDGEIIGSVRGKTEGGTCHVGRLFVHPGFQGRGIGTQLLLAIEKACPRPRYELFTSSLSVDNIRLYERLGYTRFREEEYSDLYRLVYMESWFPASKKASVITQKNRRTQPASCGFCL